MNNKIEKIEYCSAESNNTSPASLPLTSKETALGAPSQTATDIGSDTLCPCNAIDSGTLRNRQEVNEHISPLLSSLPNPVLSPNFVLPGSLSDAGLISLPAPTGTVPASQNNVASVPASLSLSDSGGALRRAEIQKTGVQRPIICSSELNYGSRGELLRHRSLLRADQQYMLNLMETKRNEYADGIPDAYFDNGYLILGLTSEKYALRYVCCGRRQGSRKIPCKQWLLCPVCAQRELRCSWARYANIYRKGTFHYLTLSFDGDLPFDATTSTRILDYWDAINAAMVAKCTSGEWRGALWVDELAVNRFLPLRVLPHAHAIIDADTISQDTLDELSEAVASYTRSEDLPAEILLKPRLRLKRIDSEYEFQKVLSYLTKAVNVVKPYSTAWWLEVANDRSKGFALNKEARELLETVPGLIRLIEGNKRKWAKGTLDPHTTSYIGEPFTQKKSKGRKKSKTKARKR